MRLSLDIIAVSIFFVSKGYGQWALLSLMRAYMTAFLSGLASIFVIMNIKTQ